MRKLIVPIVTPYYKDAFDKESMVRLIDSLDAFVDVYVPCLSSGEGRALEFASWCEVVTSVRESTQKPVYAGILKTGDIEKYLLHAEESECKGVVVELGVWSEVELQIILTSCRKKGLEVIFYNTESKLIKDVPYILSLAEHKEVVGFKDSSMDAEFIKALKGAIPENVRFEVFQGMEMAITPEEDVDGYFISLANVEPELCVQLRDDRDNFDWTKLKEVIQAHNLESEKWYIYIKQALCQRGIIRTTDLVS